MYIPEPSADLNLGCVLGVVGDSLVSLPGLVNPETLQLLLVLGQLVGQDVDIVTNLHVQVYKYIYRQRELHIYEIVRIYKMYICVHIHVHVHCIHLSYNTVIALCIYKYLNIGLLRYVFSCLSGVVDTSTHIQLREKECKAKI